MLERSGRAVRRVIMDLGRSGGLWSVWGSCRGFSWFYGGLRQAGEAQRDWGCSGVFWGIFGALLGVW